MRALNPRHPDWPFVEFGGHRPPESTANQFAIACILPKCRPAGTLAAARPRSAGPPDRPIYLSRKVLRHCAGGCFCDAKRREKMLDFAIPVDNNRVIKTVLKTVDRAGRFAP